MTRTTITSLGGRTLQIPGKTIPPDRTQEDLSRLYLEYFLAQPATPTKIIETVYELSLMTWFQTIDQDEAKAWEDKIKAWMKEAIPESQPAPIPGCLLH